MGAPGPANLTHVADYAIPLREYALVFGTAVVVTFLLTGVVRLIAVQMGVVTPIRDRDVHSLPIPRMGGVAVYAGFPSAWNALATMNAVLDRSDDDEDERNDR